MFDLFGVILGGFVVFLRVDTPGVLCLGGWWFLGMLVLGILRYLVFEESLYFCGFLWGWCFTFALCGRVGFL